MNEREVDDQHFPHWALWTEHPDVQATILNGSRADSFLDRLGYRKMPPRTDYLQHPELAFEGWLPASPIIDRSSNVVAFGSCFAFNFIEWLYHHGYFQESFDSILADLIRNPYENIGAVSQQLRWAFGEWDTIAGLWFDKDKRPVIPNEEQRIALRETLTAADVMIVTLGLSEGWIDLATGEPLWRTPPEDHFDETRYGFTIFSVTDTVREFETIERIRERYMPSLKIVYSVSPLRMQGTFRHIAPLTANSVSKAIARAGLDEFLRSRADLLNQTYFYFPGFELAVDIFPDPFEDDGRHLQDIYVELVVALFSKYYTTLGAERVFPPFGTLERNWRRRVVREAQAGRKIAEEWAAALEMERDRLQADADRAHSALLDAKAIPQSWDRRFAQVYSKNGFRGSVRLAGERLWRLWRKG